MGDGRTYHCDFCNAAVVVAVDGEQLAAGMRLDLSNIDSFLSQLANTLYQGYAESVRITAEGRVVHAIEVTLENHGFVIQRQGAGAAAQYRKLVRGVALKTTPMPLDQWTKKLMDALTQQAASNSKAAWVLARLTGNHHTDVR